MKNLSKRVFFYSPFSFMRKDKMQLFQAVLEHLPEAFGTTARIYVRYLEWDSQYFDCPHIK